METFKVFATLSLVDLISKPLLAIKKGMNTVTDSVASLSQRLGNFALAMAPAAVACSAFLGFLGMSVGTAAAFEDQMAKVGAVSRASAEEMVLLEKAARDLGASTQFTASQVAEAEQYLAMAGFTALDNIAALPGVLNLAAATATDLGRAADISSDILSAFGIEAAEMTRVADVLTLTCTTANTNMELLGDTMKYVAPVARQAGLGLEETAAMAGLLANVGIKGSQAGTTLKAMLSKLAAPAGEASKTLQSLGVVVQDSAGNLRNPVTLLGEMSKALEGMGTAQQLAALKTIVGEEAIAGFAELINKEGIGAISKYAEQLYNAEGVSQNVADRMNDSFRGSMRTMGSAWESVNISIGKIFIPITRKGIDAITAVLRAVDTFVKSPFGEAFMFIAATASTAIIAITLFTLGLWGITKVIPALSKGFLFLKTSLFGLGAPILAIIAVVGLLFAAYKANFGGIADIVDSFYNKVRLVISGVIEIFKSLKGSSFEIRGELAKEIDAAGLTGLITNVAKTAFRIKELFLGIWESVSSAGLFIYNLVEPVISLLISAFIWILDLLGLLTGGLNDASASTDISAWKALGQTLGVIASVVLGIVGTFYIYNTAMTVYNGIAKAVTITQKLFNLAFNNSPMGKIIVLITALITAGIWLYNNWETISTICSQVWNGIVAIFETVCTSISTFFSELWQNITGTWDGITNSISASCNSIIGFVSNLWAEITNFFASIDLFEMGANILNSLKEGIMSKFQALKDCMWEALDWVRNLLPFSDAKEGPLSTLTLSGQRLMETIGQGVGQGSASLFDTVSTTLDTVSGLFGSAWSAISNSFGSTFDNIAHMAGNTWDQVSGWFGNLFSGDIDIDSPEVPETFPQNKNSKTETNNTITINSINLPNVKDAKDFSQALEEELMEYGVS